MNIKGFKNNEEILINPQKDNLEALYKEKDKYLFKCTCNNMTKMILNNRDGNYFFCSGYGQKNNHELYCDFNSSDFKRFKGYDNKDGEFHYSVDLTISKNTLTYKKDLELNNMLRLSDKSILFNYLNKQNIDRNSMSFNNFVRKFLIEIWNHYYKREYIKHGCQINEFQFLNNFMGYIYGYSSKMYYNGLNIHSLFNNTNSKYKFTFGIFKDAKKYKKAYKVSYYVYRKKYIEKSIFVPAYIWERVESRVRVSSGKNLIFFKTEKKTNYKLELELIPISNFGLPIDSIEESRLTNSLIKKCVLFEKPYEILNSRYPFVPTIIIDPESIKDYSDDKLTIFKGVRTIVEIFNSNDKLKTNKISIGTSIEKPYEFRYILK